jgi:hypothetical protein
MTKSKVTKSAQIPKLGTAARKKLLEIITEIPIYKEYIEKGRRFFSQERLVEIEKLYKKTGLSWDEIDRVVSQQGLTLTQATFRKYLQAGLIPKDVKYSPTASGRVAYYDVGIISHINLVLFLFSVPSNNILHFVIDVLNQFEITAAEAVESKLDSNLYTAICVDLYQENGDVSSAISEVLKEKYPETEAVALKLIHEIEDIFDKQLHPKIDELVQYLEKYQMLLSDIPESE